MSPAAAPAAHTAPARPSAQPDNTPEEVPVGPQCEPAWIAEIRLRAARRVRWLRHLWASHRYDGEYVLAISHSEIDRALLPHGQLRAAEHDFYRSDQEAAAMSVALNALTDRPGDSRWRHLITTLGLSAPEAHLAALCLAGAADPALRRVFGYLLDLQEPTGPTPALVTDLFSAPPFWCPAPEDALLRWQVAHPLGDGRDPYTTSTPWDADALLLAGLLAPDPTGSSATGWHTGSHGTLLPAPTPPLLREDICEAIVAVAAALSTPAAAQMPLQIELIGAPGSGRSTLAAAAAARLGRGLLSVDAHALAQASDPRAAAICEIRRARLQGCALEFEHADALPAAAWPLLPGCPLTFLSTEEPLAERAPRIRQSFRLPPITRSQRIALWKSLSDQPAPRPVTDWALRPAEVATAAQVAPAGPDTVHHVCRRQLLANTPELLTPLPLRYTWDDLVISARTRAHLREVDEQARNRAEVLEDWGLGRLTSMGGGLSALFAGPSGTGKTMAAQVLARSLGLDLYRVDLAGVVSKYIGETEKHLKAVFDACERAPVLLLFDEADALFGKRTEVKDAHDRYANIEVDYILARMEAFDGVAVLATNRKGDLDSAFVRRIAFIIDFAAPNPTERERLWRLALHDATHPDGGPLVADLDWTALATEFDLTGAAIKSAALAAAFLARSDHTPIHTHHVLAATRRELEKQGQIMRPTRRGAT